MQIFAQLGMVPGLIGYRMPLAQAVGFVSSFLAAVFLLRGTWRLLGRTPGRSWWIAGALGVLATGAVPLAGGSVYNAMAVPVGFLAFAYLSMGLALFRHRRQMSGLGVSLTIFALMATGLHFADFPFLADKAWFIPWGLGLALFNDVTLSAGFIVLTFDRTQAAREQADARYAELADTIGVGTYTSTLPGRFSAVNGALVRMLGYGSADEVLALELPRDVYFTPTERPLDSDELVGVNAVWRRKDGRPLVVQLHGRVMRDAAGQVLAWRGFVVDRTEAHAIEEALRRTQKLDAVGRLAGGVAHDFNNLLTIILSSLELMTLRPGEPALLKEALEATDQAAQLTRRLLAFGRKQANRAEPVDVGATVLRTVEMLGRSLGARHSVDTSSVTRGLWVNMDGGHLEQALVNLVLNAKDAMSEGGVIELSTRSASRGARDGVELVVKDPGHGMTPEQQARIFEPFFTTRDPGRGTGLGLSTVHGIVTQAGGAIDVESAPQKGSRFSLWFPATAPPAVKVGERDVPAVTSLRVLVVDDEPGIRRTVCRMLEAAGHRPAEASSGNEAIALVAGGERFDVMLSDVRMADGDGPAAAREVRALAPAMRVVLMSGFQDEPDEVMKGSADAFLAKPFTRGALLAAIAAGSTLRAAG
ncbi:MAG: ATP-binding protein [Archangium sp.]|nr:ATP-binding protein [Archangium sp.]